MTARRTLSALALALLASAALAQGARATALFLEGTWAGKWSCQGFDGARYKLWEKESTLRVTHLAGTALAARIDDALLYNGAAITDDGDTNKGEIVLTQCGTDLTPLVGDEAEIIRATVKTKASGAGRIRGISIAEGGAYDIYPPYVLTCKFSYKLVDPADPGVVACP